MNYSWPHPQGAGEKTGGYANNQAVIISAKRGQRKTLQTPFFCSGGKCPALGQTRLLPARQPELPSDSTSLHSTTSEATSQAEASAFGTSEFFYADG